MVYRTSRKSTGGGVATTDGIARPLRSHRYYLASQVVVNGLRLFSRTDRSLEVALRFHIALVTIKQRASAEEGSSEERMPFEDLSHVARSLAGYCKATPTTTPRFITFEA